MEHRIWNIFKAVFLFSLSSSFRTDIFYIQRIFHINEMRSITLFGNVYFALSARHVTNGIPVCTQTDLHWSGHLEVGVVLKRAAVDTPLRNLEQENFPTTSAMSSIPFLEEANSLLGRTECSTLRLGCRESGASTSPMADTRKQKMRGSEDAALGGSDEKGMDEAPLRWKRKQWQRGSDICLARCEPREGGRATTPANTHAGARTHAPARPSHDGNVSSVMMSHHLESDARPPDYSLLSYHLDKLSTLSTTFLRDKNNNLKLYSLECRTFYFHAFHGVCFHFLAWRKCCSGKVHG